METGILINALGQAIFESCGQALLIYMALQVFFQLFPGISSKYRYDINYLGLTIIACWFLASLVKIYLDNASLANYGLLIYSGAAAGSAKHLPTLLQQAETFINGYAKYITDLYLIGLVLHIFRLLGGFYNINYIRKQKNLTHDALWSARVEQIAGKLKILKKVSLYFSAHIRVPLTIGYLKPIIIFPLSLINNLDNDQVEAILLHELAHVKRQDYLLNILQCIMETILCFNPFVWLISKTIRQEREYCCDDMVVDEDYNNYTYAKALFIVAQQNNQNYSLAMASAGTKKYPLLNRIKRLHSMKTNDSLPKFHLLVILTITAIGALLLWGIPQYSLAKTKTTRKPLIYTINNFSMPAPVIHTKSPVRIFKKKLKVVYADTSSNPVLRDTSVSGTKPKFKIVIEDDKGNKKEYDSINDLPPADRSEFLKENPSLGMASLGGLDSMKFASLETMARSPEFKKQMLDMKIQAEKMSKMTNSAAFKKQQLEMKIDAEKLNKLMKKQFNSPEYKKQMKDLQDKIKAQYDSPEFKKQMDDLQKKMKAEFDSPEYQKQMQDLQDKIKAQYDSPDFKKQMENLKLQAEKMGSVANSPEFKKQVLQMKIDAEKMGKLMNKQFNSPEWKKQMEDMQKNIQDEVQKAVQQDSLKSSN